MAEIKRTFIKGKMNQDLDERLIQDGEYREAQNIKISESDDSDSGAIETVKGNELISQALSPAIAGTPEVIGEYTDIKNKRLIYFISNFAGLVDFSDNIRKITRARGAGTSSYSGSSTDDCAIVMMDMSGGNSFSTLVQGAWLNFSKNHLITGVQLIDDLLFWTDDYNQPRKINITRAIASSTHYQYEDQISVAKYAPYETIRLANNSGVSGLSTVATTTIGSDYLQDKFVRFSYRYKYEDGEYSIIAPFTGTIFKPLNTGIISNTDDSNNAVSNEPTVSISKHEVYRKTTVDIMQNAINKAVLRIPIPNINERGHTSDDFSSAYANPYNITNIEILLKESDGLSFKLVKDIPVTNDAGNVLSAFNSNVEVYTIKPTATSSTFYRQVYSYTYRSEKPYRTLPEDEIMRVFDQVPLLAKSLEISSNRVIFGNYVENYPYPLDYSGRKGMNFVISDAPKGDNEWHSGAFAANGKLQYLAESYPYHSTKQRRNYQVGIVFADKFGRQSPVILTSHVPSSDSDLDTHNIAPITGDLSDDFGGAYSWSNERAAYGRELVIDFKDTEGVIKNSTGDNTIYNGTFGADYNPHGWYSYRIVVQQTQQDYYNVYCSHPFDGWNNIDSLADTTYSGKSWLSLYGDNINKVPRAINDQDVNRPGIMGSDVELYPKVVFAAAGESAMNNQVHYLTDVISLGDAFEQNMFISGDDNVSGTGGFSVYNFIYGKDKNPLIAELPNMKIYGATADGNSLLETGYIKTATTDANTFVLDNDQDPDNTDATTYANDFFNDYTINHSSLKFVGEEGKVVKVTDYTATSPDDTVTITSEQTFVAGDMVLFSKYYEGLSVFETEPFESKIDIFYETATSGLIEDLNAQVQAAATGGPTGGVWASGETVEEFTEAATASGLTQQTVGTFKAVRDATLSSGHISFAIENGYGTDETGGTHGFTLGSVEEVGGVGYNNAVPILTNDTYAFKNTVADNITLRIIATDSVGSTTHEVLCKKTNAAPTFSFASIQTAEVAASAAADQLAFEDPDISNGASKTAGELDNLSIAFNFSSYTTANSYFTIAIDDNNVQLKTTSSWAAAADAFFDLTSTQRTCTLTLTDNTDSSALLTDTLPVLISESSPSETGNLVYNACAYPEGSTDVDDLGHYNSDPDYCAEVASQYWAVQGTGASAPTVSEGYLVLVPGNILYTNSGLSSVASNGCYNWDIASGDYSAKVGNSWPIDGSGGSNNGIVDLVETGECDDRDY